MKYSIDQIRLAISLAVIGQQLLIALIFLQERPRKHAQYLGASLLLGAVAYLIQSNPALREALDPFQAIVAALAIAMPYLLWAFSILVFEIRSVPVALRYAVYAVPVLVWAVIVADPDADTALRSFMEGIHRTAALLLIAHAIVAIYLDRRNDLLEPRRRYRTFFIFLIALQAAAVLIVEVVFGFGAAPGWLELINVVMIALLTVGLSLPILTMDGRILWHRIGQSEATARQASDAAGKGLQAKLESAMQRGIHHTQGLGIRELAAELGIPEHQLRRVINGQLGYRNFSSFLNHHRIGDAMHRLADPESSATPVLTIAMDLGYGSIGPFNRAFKEATGMTPTEYRAQNLGRSRTDSE